MPHSIGIDLGTTNVKAVLVSAEGAVLASTERPLPTVVVGDTAEQDAESVWHLVLDCLTALVVECPDNAKRVETIGVCSQYSSLVGVDASANPTTPLIMWSDQRGTDHSWAILSRHEKAFMTWVEHHGIPPVGSGLSLAHLLYLQLEHPGSHASATAYVEPMDYLTARLTGRITATQASSFMLQLCDNRSLGATGYDPDLVAMSGVDPSRLPPLVDIEGIVGPILPAVAVATGLPANTLVATGTNDTATVGVASGALTGGVAGLAIGTTSVIVDTIDSFGVDLDHEIVSMPGPYGDGYLVMAENGLGGRVLQHVMTRIVHPDDSLGHHTVDDPFASVDLALVSSPPGAGGVMFLPWLAGSLAPKSSREMRGGFINMSLETGRVDLVRSVTEGVAHNLGRLLPHIEAMTGRMVAELRFTGGGGRCPGWAQVIADVLDRSVAIVKRPQLATARAAALLALVRHGALTRSDLAHTVEIATVHDPIPRHRALYDHRQSQFEACFEALLPIHTALGGTP